MHQAVADLRPAVTIIMSNRERVLLGLDLIREPDHGE